VGTKESSTTVGVLAIRRVIETASRAHGGRETRRPRDTLYPAVLQLVPVRVRTTPGM